MKKIITIMFLLLLVGCSKDEYDGLLYKYVGIYDEYLNTTTYITIYHNENYYKKYENKVDDGVKFSDIVEFQGIEDILLESHNVFDAHSNESELGKLNNFAHIAPVKISEELYDMIKQALHFAEISDGAYDPTVGPLADLWGIDETSWFMGGTIPTESAINDTLELVDYKKVIIDDVNKTVFYEQEGVKLDLGGIVKGYVTERIRDYLTSKGVNNGIVNVGSSSQLTIGTRCVASEELNGEVTLYEDTGNPWNIGTSDPFDLWAMNDPIGVFPLVDKALSTSGSALQFFEKDGERYHHIFDTKTGYPVDNELIVVQLQSDNLVGVDAVSTMIYVLGLEAGMEYIESIDGMDAIFITYDKEIYISSGFDGYKITTGGYNLKTK
ncbi:FAD:protein FMN transferase [Mycoplasmatota bacterium zrk1]